MTNATRIPTSEGNRVEPTDSHTRRKIQQFMKMAMKSLLMFSLVINLERTRGTPMISTTVMTTCVISTNSPRVNQIMNGIHTSDTR